MVAWLAVPDVAADTEGVSDVFPAADRETGDCLVFRAVRRRRLVRARRCTWSDAATSVAELSTPAAALSTAMVDRVVRPLVAAARMSIRGAAPLKLSALAKPKTIMRPALTRLQTAVMARTRLMAESRDAPRATAPVRVWCVMPMTPKFPGWPLTDRPYF